MGMNFPPLYAAGGSDDGLALPSGEQRRSFGGLALPESHGSGGRNIIEDWQIDPILRSSAQASFEDGVLPAHTHFHTPTSSTNYPSTRERARAPSPSPAPTASMPDPSPAEEPRKVVQRRRIKAALTKASEPTPSMPEPVAPALPAHTVTPIPTLLSTPAASEGATALEPEAAPVPRPMVERRRVLRALEKQAQAPASFNDSNDEEAELVAQLDAALSEIDTNMRQPAREVGSTHSNFDMARMTADRAATEKVLAAMHAAHKKREEENAAELAAIAEHLAARNAALEAAQRRKKGTEATSLEEMINNGAFRRDQEKNAQVLKKLREQQQNKQAKQQQQQQDAASAQENDPSVNDEQQPIDALALAAVRAQEEARRSESKDDMEAAFAAPADSAPHVAGWSAAPPQAQHAPLSSYSSLAHAIDPAFARHTQPARGENAAVANVVVEDAVVENEDVQVESVDTSAQARGLSNWDEFKRRLSERNIGGEAPAEDAMEEGNELQEGWQGASSQCASHVHLADYLILYQERRGTRRKVLRRRRAGMGKVSKDTRNQKDPRVLIICIRSRHAVECVAAATTPGRIRAKRWIRAQHRNSTHHDRERAMAVRRLPRHILWRPSRSGSASAASLRREHGRGSSGGIYADADAATAAVSTAAATSGAV